MIEIVPMKTDHVGQVAQLHLKNLQTRFSGNVGIELLKLYYETVTKETGGCGYVAIRQTEVVGYVCGIWDVSKLRNNLFLDHWFLLVVLGTIQILGQPRMMFDFLARFRSSNLASNLSDGSHRISYELRPIVVSPTMRHVGLGQILVKQLINDARSRGYDSMHLYTELDNKSAKKFYEKAGFREIGRTNRNSGQYILYKLEISQDYDS